MTMVDDILYLYGGDRPWAESQWVDSDDRVRGGASRSHLTAAPDARTARFHGTLDTATLGGAGFASQHSRRDAAALPWPLDLGAYDGLVVSVAGPGRADGKLYALTLKDGRAPPSPPRGDGRERASLSWEAVFRAERPGDVYLRWRDFRPTYRGRPCPGAGPLDVRGLRQVGLMMRSFFGRQSGPFDLALHGIAAFRERREEHDDDDDDDEDHLKAGLEGEEKPRRAPWWRSVLCGLL